MSRMTMFAGFLLTSMSLALAQEPQPQFPEDAMATRQLIVWSRLQEPQPAPQPLPPRDNRVPQPDQQGRQPADPQTPPDQSPTTQSFTGKIIKDGNQYVLKVAGNITYGLQAQDKIEQYENKSVRVVGNLDKATNRIQIIKIELLS
jgi:uncharacterized protein DUF5818